MRRFFTTLVLVTAVMSLCSTSFAGTQYVITDDDNGGVTNTATVYTVSGSALTQKTVITLGGLGLGGGYFSTNRASVAHSAKYGNCAYVSNAGSTPPSITGIDLNTLTATGTFNGGSSDNAGIGMGLTAKVNYLYASMTGSNTIATFTEQPGCKLNFKGDTPAVGLNGGGLASIQAHFGILVATFVDGSIASWNVSHGIPVSNNDAQLTTGFIKNGSLALGVDITQDAKFAIFGDAEFGPTEVEVSAIGPSGLSTTVDYCCGVLGSSTINSNNVRLSPDETLIYVTNNFSGNLTAASFNKSTGVVGSFFCVSPVFKNFGNTYFDGGSNVARDTSGNGTVVFVAESGGFQGGNAVASINVTSGSNSCSLAEDSSSPAADPSATGFMLSVAGSPARKF